MSLICRYGVSELTVLYEMSVSLLFLVYLVGNDSGPVWLEIYVG